MTTVMEMIRTRENTENQGDDTHGGTDLDLVGHFYHETTSEDGRSMLSNGSFDSLQCLQAKFFQMNYEIIFDSFQDVEKL